MHSAYPPPCLSFTLELVDFHVQFSFVYLTDLLKGAFCSPLRRCFRVVYILLVSVQMSPFLTLSPALSFLVRSELCMCFSVSENLLRLGLVFLTVSGTPSGDCREVSLTSF